jgi:hypothetical protein
MTNDQGGHPGKSPSRHFWKNKQNARRRIFQLVRARARRMLM